MSAAVIIPTLNEAGHIRGLLAQCCAVPKTLVSDILVADGGSRDATRHLVMEAARHDPRVRLIDNPWRIQSAGINLAVAQLAPTVTAFVRIDAHADYADDYVERVLAELARTGADVLATRLRTEGRTPLQRAIATASNSPFGAGGSPHRQGGYSGWVDHGHHAGFARATFDRLGGYDESFIANEDAEYDARVRRSGGRIWLAGDIEIGYYPRATLRALARQYYRYGVGRAANVAKHREIRPRQLMPPAVVVALALSFAISPLYAGALAIPAAYLAGLTVATAILIRRTRQGETLLALPALTVMHLAWGSGFLRGFARAIPAQLFRHGNNRSKQLNAGSKTGEK